MKIIQDSDGDFLIMDDSLPEPRVIRIMPISKVFFTTLEILLDCVRTSKGFVYSNPALFGIVKYSVIFEFNLLEDLENINQKTHPELFI